MVIEKRIPCALSSLSDIEHHVEIVRCSGAGLRDVLVIKLVGSCMYDRNPEHQHQSYIAAIIAGSCAAWGEVDACIVDVRDLDIESWGDLTLPLR